jgi:hypothetical protein
MKWTSLRGSDGYRVLLAAVLLCAAAPSVVAQDRAIEGVWALTVTSSDCASATPLGPPSTVVATFHQGGTVTTSINLSAFAPNQRTPLHGLWGHAGGATYTQRVLAAIFFETPPNPPVSPGFRAGWAVDSATVTLRGPDQITGVHSIQFFDAGRQPYRTICATSVGERFK